MNSATCQVDKSDCYCEFSQVASAGALLLVWGVGGLTCHTTTEKKKDEEKPLSFLQFHPSFPQAISESCHCPHKTTKLTMDFRIKILVTFCAWWLCLYILKKKCSLNSQVFAVCNTWNIALLRKKFPWIFLFSTNEKEGLSCRVTMLMKQHPQHKQVDALAHGWGGPPLASSHT